MTTLKELSTTHKVIAGVIGLLVPAILSVVLATRNADINRISQIEERLFEMKGSVITQPQLSQTKAEIVQLVGIQVAGLQSQITLLSQQNDKLMNQNQQILEELRRKR